MHISNKTRAREANLFATWLSLPPHYQQHSTARSWREEHQHH